jgi:hypothetical protein
MSWHIPQRGCLLCPELRHRWGCSLFHQVGGLFGALPCIRAHDRRTFRARSCAFDSAIDSAIDSAMEVGRSSGSGHGGKDLARVPRCNKWRFASDLTRQPSAGHREGLVPGHRRQSKKVGCNQPCPRSVRGDSQVVQAWLGGVVLVAPVQGGEPGDHHAWNRLPARSGQHVDLRAVPVTFGHCVPGPRRGLTASRGSERRAQIFYSSESRGLSLRRTASAWSVRR